MSIDKHLQNNFIVFSASSAIGSAFVKQIGLYGFEGSKIGFSRADCPDLIQDLDLLLGLDIHAMDKLEESIKKLTLSEKPLWVLISIGWLHDQLFKPEKTYQQINSEQLQKSFLVNTITPALITKILISRFKGRNSVRIGILSARIGSISDNRMGGWYSYRSSKAALNMLIKNFSIELSRTPNSHVDIFAIQPGTTDSPLSKPFTKNIRNDQLQSPEFTAEKIMELFINFKSHWNGQMIDYEGNLIQP